MIHGDLLGWLLDIFQEPKGACETCASSSTNFLKNGCMKKCNFFFINQKSTSSATLFLTMAYQWIYKIFIPSSISKSQFLFVMSNVFWDLQTFIIFLSKTIQKIVAPLTWLTNKDKFKWDKNVMKIFKLLKMISSQLPL